MSGRSALFASVGAILIFVVVACIVFSDALWAGGIISSGNTDVFLAFYHTRGFAAREILHGNLPLWNPYIYSGSTFFMDPEIGLFYPLNAIYLLLPLPAAINADIILHLTLLASLTFFWMYRRGNTYAEALTAGFMLSFSGAYFMHVYAGHLGILATAAWSPLVLMALDENARSWRKQWVLAGLFGVTLSFLAGHLQYVIIIATVALLYAVHLAIEQKNARPLICVVGWYAGGLFLAMIQILPALDGLTESYRAELTARYLGSFSLHPENLLTLVASEFFGNIDVLPYWGKEYLWEQSLFIGVPGLFLALYGAHGRAGRSLWVVAGILLIVAVGIHTPLFAVTSQYVPFLNKLRGHGKFIFGVTLILVLLAMRGAARLREGKPSLPVVFLTMGAAVGFAVTAYTIGNGFSVEEWRQLMWQVGPADGRFEWYGDPLIFQHAEQIAQAQSFAAVSLYGVAAKWLVLTALLFAARHRPFARYLILGFMVLEMLFFARAYERSFPLARLNSPDLEAPYTQELGGDRIYNTIAPNRVITYRLHDVNGYNTKIQSQRYKEFLETFLSPENWRLTAEGHLAGRGRLPDMLRLRFINLWEADAITNYRVEGTPLPRFLLLDRFSVYNSKLDLFNALGDPAFDPNKTVLLERSPSVTPFIEGPAGTVGLISEDTDHLVIEAALTKPQILLVTDSYSRHWKARSLTESVQTNYEVLPANHILRAIPLMAGRHRFVLEFAPLSFTIGAWVSALSWLILVLFGSWFFWRRHG